MNAAADRPDGLDTLLAATPFAANDPLWLGRMRAQARQRLASESAPGRRSERWRYTSLDDVLGTGYEPAASPAELPPVTPLGELPVDRLVLLNGHYEPALSDLGGLPRGVHCDGLAVLLATAPQRLERHLGRLTGDDASPFAALALAGLADGAVVRIEPQVRLERPLEILHLTVAGAKPHLAQPRLLVIVAEGAELTLIERFETIGEATAFNNLAAEVFVGPGAALTEIRLQREGEQSFHLFDHRLRLDQASRYHGVQLALGGRWARTEQRIAFTEPGAVCRLDGLYLVDDRRLTDHHLDLLHAVPGCRSETRYRGILGGRGRAVFDGRIEVAREAQKSDAHLSNDNLLLSREAEVDTKPQLEIHADDVACSHGTTVGQIEPDALFYLRARGVPEADARRMLCLGFARALFDAITDAPLRAALEGEVERALERVR